MPSKDDSVITLASVAHIDRWVGWREEMVAERRTKVPYNPRSGGRAASDNPRTWATHDEAQKWAETQHDAGTGVMFGPINDNIGALCGVDLDSCRDKATGTIAPWAQEIIDRFASYTEISPSGTGAHVLFRLAPSDTPIIEALFDGKFGRAFKRPSAGDHPPAIEVYRGRRYFAVTWEAISSEDELRRIAIVDLEWLLREAGPKFAGPPKPPGAGGDDSRSANAYRAGAALKVGGATYEQMRDALLAHQDPEIAEWAQSKRMANGERELHRIFDKTWKPGSIVTIGGVEKRLVTLETLNERYALLEARGKPSVYINRIDCMLIKEDDLRRRLADEVALTGVKKAKPVYQGAYTFWTGHARRHIYQRIAFTSKETPPDTLNLFRGLGVTPRKGNCSLVIDHIREVICSGDAIATEAMLDLQAWQIQHIGKPSRVIVIMKSKEHQAGKGLLLSETLLKIYGSPSGFIPATTEQVVGKFNDALLGCVYVFLDEVMFSGDRKAADAIKRLATTTLYGIETKGLPVVQCPVAVNLWAATNHEVAAFIEEQDVRYWVLDVSEHRVGDTDYFTKLVEEIENGGREAFAHYLLNRDVSGFVPLRDTPKNNDAKREMIRRSINPFDARKWLEDCCLTEQIIGAADSTNWIPGQVKWRKWIPGEVAPFHVLANAYTAWQRDVKSPVRPEPTPKGSLGEVLNKAGFGKEHTRAGSDRTLPHPDDCLKNLFKPPSREDPDSVLP